jgi:hypothetical protein
VMYGETYGHWQAPVLSWKYQSISNLTSENSEQCKNLSLDEEKL